VMHSCSSLMAATIFPSTMTVEHSPALVRNRKGTHFIWEEDKNEEFMRWWKITEHSKGPNPHWGSKRRKTEIWSHFAECAQITSGEPALSCRTCHQTLVHPSVRRNRNSAAARHIQDSCTITTGQKCSQQSITELVAKVCVI
jgi:hypothetical protein